MLTSGQRQMSELFPHETVVSWMMAPSLCFVYCDTGRMVLTGQKDPSKTILAPNFPFHLDVRDCLHAVRQGL